jgi:hypothetical protein
VQYISEALVCTMDCHANILYHYQTITSKYAAMAVQENFFYDTSSPGNRTTHNYPNQAHRFVQYSDMVHKGRNNGCIIDNQQYSGLIKIHRDLLSKQEKD